MSFPWPLRLAGKVNAPAALYHQMFCSCPMNGGAGQEEGKEVPMSTRRKTPLRLPAYPPPAATGSAPGLPEGDSLYDNIYRDALGGADPAVLDRMRRLKLQDEIVMLRVVMRKVAQQATEGDTPLDAWLATMNSLSQTATRLARLLEIELTLVKSEDNSLSLLSRAIYEKMREVEP